MRYDEDRDEMLGFVPRDAQRVLDVGCATGRFGAALRKRSPSIELWGIDTEVSEAPFRRAYDRCLHGSFPECLDGAEQFDCVVFNDVLEHMIDPWGAVQRCRDLVTTRGVVVASLPNVRHINVLVPLALHGRWTYRETGILDRTHLRFFTRSTSRELFEQAGFDVSRLEPIRLRPSHGRIAALNRILGGRLVDFLAERFALSASPR